MKNEKIQILLVEDNPDNVELIREMLSGAENFSCDVTVANSLVSAIENLRSHHFDVILLDLGLPDSQEFNTLSTVYGESPGTPTVVVSALDDEAVKKKFLELGLSDYLVKGEFDGLSMVQVIRHAIERETEVVQGEGSAAVKRRIAFLEENEKRYRIIFENSALAIMMTDSQDRIISCNELAGELLGMNHDDLYLKPVSSLYTEEEWMRIRSLHKDEGSKRHNLETVMKKKDGTLIDIDISLSILTSSEGKMTGSISILKDITKRKKAEVESIQEKHQLEIYRKAAVDQEMRIIAMKKEVNALLREKGEAVKYEKSDQLELDK